MKKNKYEYIKFLTNELLTIITNIILYNLLVRFKINIYLASIIAFVISLIINYIGCLKFVFKPNKNIEINKIKFIIYDTIGHLTKHFFIKILYYNFFLNLSFAKIISNIIILIYNYITKKNVFSKNYSLKNINIIFRKINNYWKKIIQVKYINVLFKFLPRNILVFIFFIGSIYYTMLFIRDNNDVILYKQEVANDTIGPFINDEITINFNNVNIDENINRICLVFGTYGRKNDSDLIFNLYNLDKKVFSKKINTNILLDGKGYCFNVPTIKGVNIENYKLKVISENANIKNNVTLFRNEKTEEVTMYLKNNRGLMNTKNLIMFTYVIIFLLINFYINKKGNKLNNNKFLLLMLVYILSILFIYPPLENPDEPSHMHSSYNLSQNLFNADKITEVIVPNSIDCLNYSKIQYLDRVTNFDDVKYCLKESKNNKKVNSLFGSSNKISNSFLGHTPQAISIKIADFISDSPLFIFYFARLGNFILSFIILYFAVKIAPKGKNIFLFVGVLPMFVQQITSLSYDAILNSLALLYIAYIIKIYNQKENIVIKDMIIPTIFLLVSITVKVVYVPLAILLLFIPKDKFKNLKQYLIFIISIIVLVLLGNYLIKNILFVPENISNAGVNMQLNYLIKNPLDIVSIGINTLIKNGTFYLRGIIGYFGWFRFCLSDFTVMSCFMMLGILAISEKEVIKFSNKSSKIDYKKIIVVISILLSIGAIFLSMYLFWSTYKLEYVDGVQGRYFIPLIPIIVVLLSPKINKIKFNQVNLYSFINILLLQYVIYAITFFY